VDDAHFDLIDSEQQLTKILNITLMKKSAQLSGVSKSEIFSSSLTITIEIKVISDFIVGIYGIRRDMALKNKLCYCRNRRQALVY